MDTFDRDKKVGSRIDRRTFLKVGGAVGVVAAAGGLEGILAAHRAPAYAQGTKLHWVRWVDFIPEADVELKRQMPEASKVLGAEVTLETINANDLQPRITAAVQSGSGADIFMFQYNWAQLYANSVVDVSDVANEIAKAEGGFYDVYGPSARVGGRWLAMPHSIIGNAVAYRRSWLKEVGANEFPKTWDEARKVFSQLKKKGKPYGQTLGHTFGDAPTFAYPVLWNFGGAETDASGKKVVINSKGTVESVKFMQAFWKEASDEGGLAWDDTNNNRAFHAGEISASLNGASIRQDKDDTRALYGHMVSFKSILTGVALAARAVSLVAMPQDLEIQVRIGAIGHGPEDRVRVVRIDILVDRDHVLAGSTVPRGGAVERAPDLG